MKKPTLKLFVGGWHLLKQVMAFGNPTAGGFTTMAEALWAVARLNEELRKRFGLYLSVSAHWWHELLMDPNYQRVGYSAQWNNPRAINLRQWVDGVKTGMYAPIGRIIPPGFGLPDSDNGAFINPDSKRRKLAKDMLFLSFEISEWVKAKRAGEGNVIFWTGPDGLPWQWVVQGRDELLGHELNSKLEPWKLIIEGISSGVFEARERGYLNTELEIEGKPAGDPSYLDVFTDTTLEIKGIVEINKAVGASVASWQGEFCHSRGSGQTFASALKQAIEADVFGGKIHFNSGGLGRINFTEMLSKPEGTPMSLFPQYVDNDFLPWEGVQEWIEDQKNTIQIGKRWSAETGLPFEVEFDARFSRYADTISRLRKSVEWTIDVFNRV